MSDSWSFTNILSPALKDTPSIVCVPDKLIFWWLVVVAAFTDFFISKPLATPSTYDFVAASCAFDGSLNDVI